MSVCPMCESDPCDHPVEIPGWYLISTAKLEAKDVRLLLKDGREVVGHWACDLSGEEQPPFKGWFTDLGSFYSEVSPTHWRPL